MKVFQLNSKPISTPEKKVSNYCILYYYCLYMNIGKKSNENTIIQYYFLVVTFKKFIILIKHSIVLAHNRIVHCIYNNKNEKKDKVIETIGQEIAQLS